MKKTLLTDGMAYAGITTPLALAKKAEEIAQSGVQVSTFGLDEDFEEDLLQQMAEAGKGNFYYMKLQIKFLVSLNKN